MQGFGPLRFVGGQILRGQEAPVRLEEALYFLRDVSLVKPIKGGLDGRGPGRTLRLRVCLRLHQLAQGGGVVGIAIDRSGAKGLAPGKEDLRGGWIERKLRLAAIDGGGQHGIDGITVLRVLDGRGEDLGQAHGAEAIEGVQIPAEVPGHDARLHAGVQGFRRHGRGLEGQGRRARHGERPHLPRFLVEHGHETVAADAVHFRLGHGFHGPHRGGRVESVAALEENLQTRGGRDRMSGRDHTVARRHHGTGGVDAGRSRRLGGLGLRESNRGKSRGEPDAYENDPEFLQ